MKKQIALICGLLCAALLVFGFVGAANAFTVQTDGSTVTDILNLEIIFEQGGSPTLYNVAFVNSTPGELYGKYPNNSFPFDDAVQTSIAANTVNREVLNSNALEYLTVGPSADVSLSRYLVSFDAYDNQGIIEYLSFGGVRTVTGTGPQWSRTSDFPTENQGFIYADFTVVPIPGAVWLLGSGLLGVIGFRRKRPKT